MLSKIDDPLYNDNRKYEYDESFYERAEFPIICNFINSNTDVIDLGCGNGSLMKFILDRKKVNITGVDISHSGVNNCLKNGLRAKNAPIDQAESYLEFVDDQFDYAICNVTLQMVMYPDVLLKEMRRISKKQIISFPNFAFLGNRLDLLINGRMPHPMMHGYDWYNTGHIHQLSLEDFYKYCLKNKFNVEKVCHLGCWRNLANLFFANIFSKESVFLLSK